jgi:hypothetical protein
MVMSTCEWASGDPEPLDHPALVDNEGVTWLWNIDDCCYDRQQITHYPSATGEGPGPLLGSPIVSWDDLLDEYGPMREATVGEAAIFVETWATRPLGETS